MATLLLTTVGGAVGGPLGAAIGGMLGQAADRATWLRPPRREGPRLTDLRVQTSSYGEPIPKLWGTMRIAGTVVWAAELAETRSTSGGKQGRVTQFSYSASFAVLLSGRRVTGVRRIWADGKLLRGAAGDWKARCRFRLHAGGEDQLPDPLIASREGMAATPAHRGCALAVFEDLELADFGNRIPSLTFEVSADEGAPTMGGIIEEATGGRIAAGDEGVPIGGFLAQGSMRGVAEALAEPAGCWFAEDGERLALRTGAGDAVPVADGGFAPRGERGPSGWVRLADAGAAPAVLILGHHDPARDYQVGVQRAARPGLEGPLRRIDLPASVDAAGAATMAAGALARADAERETRELALSLAALPLPPGGRVRIEGLEGQWRITRWALEGGAVRLRLARIAAAVSAPATSSGRVLGAPDEVAGETRIAAFELPPGDEAASRPRIAVAAAGDAGWRRAALMLDDGAGGWESLGDTAPAAILGTVSRPPDASASSAIVDRTSRVEVVLVHAGMALANADAAALDRGANAAMLGGELVQFARAEQIGARRWRLSELWRGRRGSEAGIADHAPGESFVLLDPARLAVIERAVVPGAALVLRAGGIGDAGDGVEVRLAVTGRSVLPLAPVHLRVRRQGESGAVLRWVRRSRTGWEWRDMIDTPIGEEIEAYQLLVRPIAAPQQAVRLTSTLPEILLPPALLLPGGTEVEVRQIGTHGLSLPARCTIW